MNFFRKKTRKYPKPESNCLPISLEENSCFHKREGGAVIRWNFLKGFIVLFVFLFKKLSVFTRGNYSLVSRMLQFSSFAGQTCRKIGNTSHLG